MSSHADPPGKVIKLAKVASILKGGAGSQHCALFPTRRCRHFSVESPVVRNADSVPCRYNACRIGSSNLSRGMSNNGLELDSRSAEHVNQDNLDSRAERLRKRGFTDGGSAVNLLGSRISGGRMVSLREMNPALRRFFGLTGSTISAGTPCLATERPGR